MSTPPSPSQAPSSLPHFVPAGEQLANHMNDDPEVISERGSTLAPDLTPLEVLDAIPLADLLTIPLDEPESMQGSLIIESSSGMGASVAPPTEVMAPLSAAELTQKISRPSLETHQTSVERDQHEQREERCEVAARAPREGGLHLDVDGGEAGLEGVACGGEVGEGGAHAEEVYHRQRQQAKPSRPHGRLPKLAWQPARRARTRPLPGTPRMTPL